MRRASATAVATAEPTSIKSAHRAARSWTSDHGLPSTARRPALTTWQYRLVTRLNDGRVFTWDSNGTNGGTALWLRG